MCGFLFCGAGSGEDPTSHTQSPVKVEEVGKGNRLGMALVSSLPHPIDNGVMDII